MHFASVAKQNGAKLDVTGDAGTTSGAQTLVVKNKNVTERMTALVVGSTGYVNGNEAALANVIGLTKAESTKYANKWLSFPTSNQGLGELVGGLLSSQVSKELEIGGPYTYGKSATVAGQQATAINGSVATQSGGKVPGRALRPGQRHAAADPGGDQRRQRRRLVGHPRHRDVLALGREQEPDGAHRRLLAAKLVPASSSSTTAG